MRRTLVVTAAVLVLAACGGGGGTTQAEYVKRANTICRGAAKQAAAIRVPDGEDVTSLPKTAAAIVAVERTALDRLKAVHPPKEDRAEIAKWIALVDQTIDQAETSAKAQRDGDIERAISANTNGAALDRRADEIATSYGLRLCVHAASPPSTTPTSAAATTTTTVAATTTTTAATTTTTAATTQP